MYIYPIKLKSVPKQIIWGGERLRRDFNKTAPFNKIAESWELTVRDDGMSVIENGSYKGKALDEYIKENPGAVGTGNSENRFPLLIKFIDAEDDLSIQVHPDDLYALENEPDTGKTEMWYIAEADENASLIYGMKDNVSREALQNMLENGDASQVLNKISIKKGDVYFIPAGQVHAICKGVLIAEIQQNSNVTYRMYDYDRLGADGKKRELHVTKALDVIKHRGDAEIDALRFCGNAVRRDPAVCSEVLCDCSYFRVSKITCHDNISFDVDSTSFASLLFLNSNSATVTCGGVSTTAERGDSIFIPAGGGTVAVEGECEFLLSEI